MKILEKIMKVPAGLMLVPMAVTACINTFFPSVLQIGNPVTAMFTSYGTPTLIGLSLFTAGTQLAVAQFPLFFRRCGTTFVVKAAEAFLFCWLVSRFVQGEALLGISVLAAMVTFSCSNPGIYLALMNDYGDEIDKAGYGLYNILGSPILPTVAICSATGNFDIMPVVAILIPFLLGILLGNLDGDIRRFMSPANAILLPFMGFTFGANVDLLAVLKAGGGGILLSLIYIVINFVLMLASDRILLKRPGYAGVGLGAVAGVGVVTPAVIAQILPVYESAVPTATAQIATVLLITSITTPMLTRWTARRFGTAQDTARAAAD